MSLIEAFLDTGNARNVGDPIKGNAQEPSATDPLQEHATNASMQKRTGTRM